MHNIARLDASPPLAEDGAMPRPDRGYKQVVIRVPEPWVKEAEEIARLISRPDVGFEATKSDAFRVAIQRGFAVIRAEAKASSKKK